MKYLTDYFQTTNATIMLSKKQIESRLHIVDFHLINAGLEVHYSYLGNDHTLQCNPEQCADLLIRNGLINYYSGAGDLVCIELLFKDSGGNEYSEVYPWEHFSEFYDLQLEQVYELVAIVEHDKQRANVMHNASRLHPLIDSICSMFKSVRTR